MEGGVSLSVFFSLVFLFVFGCRWVSVQIFSSRPGRPAQRPERLEYRNPNVSLDPETVSSPPDPP